MNTASQFFIAQEDGAVPRWPMPPVVKGESSAITALPSKALATGAPSRSATSVTSSRAFRAPCPTRIATFRPLFRTSAAARSWSLGGWLTTGIHEDDVRAPGLPIERLSAASRIICVSFDTVR